ncbi:MAG: hypothetical protein U0941_04650 [Planctomycetaceae bacterium]
MLHGVMTLLGRSLRTDARSLHVSLTRGLILLIIYISLLITVFSRSRFGAPGLQLFRSLVWLNAVFSGLLSIGFFSTSISEEKEEDTLGLMQMAGISPLGIILGKVGGRVWQTLLLIAIQYPFMLLAVTLGGVTKDQVFSACVGIAACTFLFSGIGLLCSTIAARNRTASVLMTLGIAVYFGIPMIASEFLRYLRPNLRATTTTTAILDGIYNTSLYHRLNAILTSGFGESPWSSQVVTNIAGGIVCYLLSWRLFGVFAHSPVILVSTRGILAQPRGMLRWFAPGRPGNHPFAWTGFYFVGGGIGGLLLRIAASLLIFLIGSLITFVGGWGWNGDQLSGLLQLLGMLALTVDISILASRSIHEEVHGQTLQSLVMLPQPVSKTLYAKLGGALLVSLPFIGLMCLTLTFPRGVTNIDWYFNDHAGWFFSAHFVLVPHLAMVLSLYLRWGIIPLSVGLAIGSTTAWIGVFDAVRVGPADKGVWFGTIFVLLLCAACHFWIIRKLPEIAAER